MFPEGGGLVARMRSPNSAVTGTVRIYDFRNGVQVQLSVTNMYPGSYRVAIHERGNCSSPNLFSAGGAWAPPTWTKPPGELLPGFLANEDGNQNGYVAFVQGASVEGPNSLRGKSVVIHLGNAVGDARPGERNNRVACGVLVPGEPIT